MTESGPVERTARRAIARAKARGNEEVTPDDLLAGALAESSRFGIAWIGEWALDVRALEDGAARSREDAPDEPPAATAYAPATVELFEQAAVVAREDGSTGIGLVHLLVAFTEVECELFAELGERYGFSKTEWRAALAKGDVGLLPYPTAADVRSLEKGTQAQPDILSVDEAAEELNVHSQTVRNYVRNGKLPAYRLGGERYIRILRRDLLALLERVPTEAPEDTKEKPSLTGGVR